MVEEGGAGCHPCGHKDSETQLGEEERHQTSGAQSVVPAGGRRNVFTQRKDVEPQLEGRRKRLNTAAHRMRRSCVASARAAGGEADGLPAAAGHIAAETQLTHRTPHLRRSPRIGLLNLGIGAVGAVPVIIRRLRH